MAPSRVIQLGDKIQGSAVEIDAFLTANGQQPLSLSVDETQNILLPDKVSQSCATMLDAMEELQMLVRGPLAHLLYLLSPQRLNILASLQAIHRFKIASCFQRDEEVSFEEIATRCAPLSPSDIRRLLRLAMANGIFQEPRKGIVTHTAISKLIAEDQRVSNFVAYITEEMWGASTQIVDAISKWPGSEQRGHTGFALWNENEQEFFAQISGDPQRMQRFADTMHVLGSTREFELNDTLDSLGIEQNQPQLLIDVGGSHGFVSIAMLHRFPKLRCIVQDLPEVISKARIPQGMEDRLIFESHEILEKQSVRGADICFLRSILYDWNDEHAIQIIRNLIPSLREGSRVIINDICLPEPGTTSLEREQFIRGYDLSMKQNFNSMERDAESWRKLFEIADPRFRFSHKIRSTKSVLAILEATWAPNERSKAVSDQAQSTE